MARYSDDLDFIHDSEARVAGACASDRAHLEAACYMAWRFMPLVHDALGGWLLHPVDLALNKLLALARREEPRDFFDILHVHRTILPLGGLVWAAAGEDPGISLLSLLELLRRRGPGRPEEYRRAQLAEPLDESERPYGEIVYLTDDRFVARLAWDRGLGISWWDELLTLDPAR